MYDGENCIILNYCSAKGSVIQMAFDSLHGEKIYVSQTAQTFIFGDYFSVFEQSDDIPMIYEWDKVKSYVQNEAGFLISTEDGETYSIPMNVFGTREQVIRCRTIAEGQLSPAVCKLPRRIVPPKYNYVGIDVPEQAFTASCVYGERDINPGNVARVHVRAWRLLIIAGVVVCFLVFLILNLAFGELPERWYYYAPISLFSGIGVSAVIYIISGIIARLRYSEFLKTDISTTEEMVIVVSADGFGLIERCVYSGTDLIPWTQAAYSIETKETIVIACKDGSVCWIPKQIFPKNQQNDLSAFVAARVDTK